MLINTVILWLRDLLPIFIAAVLLYSVAKESVPLKSILLFFTSGFVLACLLIINSQFINDFFAGAGIEIISTLFYLLSYCCFLMFIWQQTSNWRIFALSALLAIKLMNFLIFISGYGELSIVLNGATLGLLIGAGISASFAILLFFILTVAYQKYGTRCILLIAAIFFAGQLTHIQHLLVQVDIIDDPSMLWDTRWLVEDDSEYGHLFNSLFGYEATPSFTHLAIFISALIPPILILLFKKILKIGSSTKKPTAGADKQLLSQITTGVHDHE